MKTNIHPQWYPEALFTCVCGATYKMGSTKPDVHVDICARCHPFYTGEMRFTDSEGKVDRFVKRMEKAKALAPELAKKKAKKKGEKVAKAEPKSLREMLMGA